MNYGKLQISYGYILNCEFFMNNIIMAMELHTLTILMLLNPYELLINVMTHLSRILVDN